MFFRNSLIGKPMFYLVPSMSREAGMNMFPEKQENETWGYVTPEDNEGRHQSPGLFLAWA